MSGVSVDGRHPGVQDINQYFSYAHLSGLPAEISAACFDLKEEMLAQLVDQPELTAGLRKLLEAKDCFVRAALSEN
jgi:hypothetical protein